MLYFHTDQEKRERKKGMGASVYLPFTMVLVKMLSPKLSCTAKLSPCMYCKDAHPGNEIGRRIFRETIVLVFYRTHREDKCNVTSIHRLVSSIVMLSSGRVLLRSIKLHNAYLVLVIAPKVYGSLCNNYICSRCRCNICSHRRSPVSTTTLIFQGYPPSHSPSISPPFFHRVLSD